MFNVTLEGPICNDRNHFMSRLFISYSRKNSIIVDQLYDQLCSSGFSVWVDREAIQAGDYWRSKIVNAIERSDFFIIALSKDSVISKNVLKELDLAENFNIPVVPVIIEEVDIPSEMQYQLSGIQRLDFLSDFAAGYELLLEVLKKGHPTDVKVLSPEKKRKKSGERRSKGRSSIKVKNLDHLVRFFKLFFHVGVIYHVIIFGISALVTYELVRELDEKMDLSFLWILAQLLLYFSGVMLTGLVLRNKR